MVGQPKYTMCISSAFLCGEKEKAGGQVHNWGQGYEATKGEKGKVKFSKFCLASIDKTTVFSKN